MPAKVWFGKRSGGFLPLWAAFSFEGAPWPCLARVAGVQKRSLLIHLEDYASGAGSTMVRKFAGALAAPGCLGVSSAPSDQVY